MASSKDKGDVLAPHTALESNMYRERALHSLTVLRRAPLTGGVVNQCLTTSSAGAGRGIRTPGNPLRREPDKVPWECRWQSSD